MAVVKKSIVKKAVTPVAKKEVVEKKAPVAPVKKTVAKASTQASQPKTTKAVAKPSVAPAKKSVAKPSVAKKPVAPAKKSVAKPSVAKKPVSGGKKLKSSNKTTNSFIITPGKQATQEAFLHRFFTRLRGLGYDEVTKDQAKSIMKAYSTTLKEVTDIASFQDTTANIYYARRIIDTRVTQPPKAADGLQTLMLRHPELKVRKLLAEEEQIKFFGHLSEEDSNIFITTDGTEINLAEVEDIEPAPVEGVADVEDTTVEEDDSQEVEEVTEELEEDVANEEEESESDDSEEESNEDEDEDSLFNDDEE